MPTILITGANRGIGLELTRQYAADGWQVYACCRSPENAYDLNKLAAKAKGAIQLCVLDVTNDAQRTALAAQLQGVPLDILFNSAGVFKRWDNQSFGATDTTDWLEVFHTNVIAPTHMMETFAANVALSERKIIANMSSRMGSMADNGSGGFYVYRSSKAALNMVTVSAARDLATQGISVVALHPGWVRTDMGGENGELSVEASASALRRNLAAVSIADSGRFIDITGETLPW